MVLNNLIRVAAGDAEALAALYEALFPRVVSHLRGRFDNLDEGEIEGAAQQTMLQVWQKAATFRGQTEREAMGWVMRIAERKALDLLRLETRSAELTPSAIRLTTALTKPIGRASSRASPSASERWSSCSTRAIKP